MPGAGPPAAGAGGGQALGWEGAVLTLMLSCQRWAFWKFSAASANLCGQSTGRSGAEEAPPSPGEMPAWQMPHSRTSAHPGPPPLSLFWLPEPLPAGLATPSARRLGLVPAAASIEASVPVSAADAHPSHPLLPSIPGSTPAPHGPERETDTGRRTRAGPAEELSTVGTWGVREGFPGRRSNPEVLLSHVHGSAPRKSQGS